MFRVFEMKSSTENIPETEIDCIAFTGSVFELYSEHYKTEYNSAYRPMREALEIRPYDWFCEGGASLEENPDIFLLLEDNDLVGSVACYKNELDDLFVRNKYKGKGYGRKLMLWGMKHIAAQGYKDVILHVAEWNKNAVQMYVNEGFIITGQEEIG